MSIFGIITNLKILLASKIYLQYLATIIVSLRIFYSRIRSLFYKPNNIVLVIATHIKYSARTIPPLIHSLNSIGIKSSDIHIFESGHIKKHKTQIDGYNYYYEDHNSFEISALIGLLEDRINTRYVFLLHDTVSIVNNRFFYLFYYYPYEYGKTYSIKDFPSMNIGCYSLNVLKNCSSIIMQLKNTDYNYNKLQDVKKQAVMFEDQIFKYNIQNHVFLATKYWSPKYKNVLYFDKPRINEDYEIFGFTKYKGNHNINDNFKITI
jgi:hypothetical protein